MMSNPDNDKQEVGRGRPPVRSRFQKGKSGNPNGRPPRSRDMRKLIEAELDQPVTVTENGRRVRLTKREILVKKLVNAAVRGDDKPIQVLLRYIGGAAEPDPVVAVDPAELARFALSHLPPAPATEVARDGGEADDNTREGEDGE